MTVAKVKVVKPIPKGWLDLKPFNQTIDIFLPFKIPLRQENQEDLNEQEKFTWSIFQEKLHAEKKRLVAVIDLVPHSHYYFVEEMVQQMGFIPYYKMGCKGGNHIPNDAIFARFCETVKHVISSRPKWNEGDFIGVHCCKGVNRTGFMICKYLITRKNITPSKVIEMFSSKRECEFDREKYVEHLLTLNPSSGNPESSRPIRTIDSSESSRTNASSDEVIQEDSNRTCEVIYSFPSSVSSPVAFKTRCNSSGSDSSKDEEDPKVVKKEISLEHLEN